MAVPATRRRFAGWVGWLAAAIAVVGAFVVLFWPVADMMAGHDVAHIAASARGVQLRIALDAARGRLMQICGGALALGAFIYTARNYRIAQQQSELNRRTLELSVQGQVTDRYSKAIDQIGAPAPEVRIGALRTLEQVAIDVREYHAAVLDVVSAFVRRQTQELDDSIEGPPREDVSTAMAVICRLNSASRGEDRGSSMVNLQDARLAGLSLPDARLAGVDLSRSVLINARLSGAQLPGTLLTQAKLARARLNGADLSGSALDRADLTQAFLERANLCDAELADATLDNAQLPGATMTGARLPAARALGANLTGADLTGAELPGADLSDAVLERAALAGVQAQGAILARARLGAARLTAANFTGARLSGADLTDADCSDCELADADLFGAVFAGATLTGVYLRGLSLYGSLLDGAIVGPDQELPDGWIRDEVSGRLARAYDRGPAGGHTPHSSRSESA